MGIAKPKPSRHENLYLQRAKLEEEELLRLGRTKAIEDLFWFAKRVCGFGDLCERPHRWIADFMTSPDPLGAEKRRSIILIPRSHGKTSVCTVAYTLWRLVRNPYEQILIGSLTQDMACNFIHRIKAVIETDDDGFALDGRKQPKLFRTLFGDWTIGKKAKNGWAEDAIQVPDWRTGQLVPFGTQRSILARGIGQQLASIHPTIAIFDDLVAETSAKSKAAREEAWNFIRLVEPLIDPGGEIWLIGTRYGNEDLYGYILDHFGEQYNVFKASIHGPVEITPPNPALSIPEIGTERIDQNYLWPKTPGAVKGFNRAIDDELRLTMNASVSADYWLQYHNRTWSTERSVFKPELRRFYYLREIYDYSLHRWRMPLNVLMTVDINFEGQFKRDNAAITVAAIDWQGRIYVIEAICGKWNWPQTEDEIFHLYKKWPNIRVIAVEAQRCRFMISRSFYESARKRGFGAVPLYPFEHKTHISKNERIQALLPYYLRGDILFPAEERPEGPYPLCPELIREMEMFDPNSKNNQDDLLDTLADILHPRLYIRPPAPEEETNITPIAKNQPINPFTNLHLHLQQQQQEEEELQLVQEWGEFLCLIP